MNTSTRFSSPGIVIVGAGIGGLTTALSLLRIGIKSQVYESSKEGSDLGAGIILPSNAMRILAELGLAEQVTQSGDVVKEIRIATPSGCCLSRNRLTGKGAYFAPPAVALHRNQLRRILAQALVRGECSVHYEKSVIALDIEKGVCHFADGENVAHELLIGCDGINSTVRSQLMISQPVRDANQVCYRGVARLDHAQKDIMSRLIESWGNAKRFGFVNIGSREVYWYATLKKDRCDTAPARDVKRLLTEAFAGWWEPIPAILRSQEASAILRNDLYDRSPVSNWSKGNVVLLGDAIHATTPNLAQGAAMAIESAAVLAKCLGRFDQLSEALRCYECQRVDRTRRITQLSWKIGQLANTEGKAACLLRNTALQLMPSWVLNRSTNRFTHEEVL